MTSSQLFLGMCIDRMKALWPDAEGDIAFVRGADGKRWTSKYFRHYYVYPWLHMLKQEGDPTLLPFTEEPGNRIPDKHYSMHMHHRAGDSHATKSRRGKKKATAIQVYEHGRWEMKRQSENMPPRQRSFVHHPPMHVRVPAHPLLFVFP